MATKHLQGDERVVLNSTDLKRLDGHPDHVCCSIQYPNSWYFLKARRDERLFLDWAVVFINPHYLWAVGTKFSQMNAAAGSGQYLREGASAFDTMFSERATDTQGRLFCRGSAHPTYLPTNEQAEVLVLDQIVREDLLGFAVANQAQAKREITRLRILDVEPPRVWIAPDFYQPSRLSMALRSGREPTEKEFIGGEND